MADSKLNEFLSTHFSEYQHRPFENERKTQLLLHDELNLKKKIINWIKTFKLEASFKSNAISEQYREKGNDLFRSNKSLNALAACRCYTNAILAAPINSKPLALAYANRSAALAEFGFYKEAYEDCKCAIDNGYPKENLSKITIRQAYFASKLKDEEKLQWCLDKLNSMALNPVFVNQKAEFEEEVLRLRKEPKSGGTPKNKKNYMVQNIVIHPQNGRYMAASKDIAKDGDILVEKAFSLVPVDEARICSNCALANIIPFPCNNCCKVFYCSLTCKKAQEKIHKYECYAYNSGFLSAIGITHLAMNTLLNGLPLIIDRLKNLTTSKKIWQKIESIAKSEEKGYAEVLSLVTNLKLMQPNEVRSYSLAAAVGTFYLMEFTPFNSLFEDSACATSEWAVIVSALILRHTTQMMANAHSCLALVCMDDSYQFSALSDIWAKPKRLKKGQLHLFSRVSVHYAAIFPYLSICNHSCAPTFRSRFDGDYVTALAREPLKVGDEIFNSYIADYRNNPKAERQEELKSIYYFDCTCKCCAVGSDDRDFLKFYKYRCQNPKCQAIFHPPNEILRWWTGEQGKISFLTCPLCKTQLNLDWYYDFDNISGNPTQILNILKMWASSDRILVGVSELRQRMASATVNLFFNAWKKGIPLSRVQFNEIGEVLKYWLEVIEQQSDVESVVYVAKSTYVLDLMAHGELAGFDCRKIRKSFDMLPIEFRSVFDNYVADFIGKRFCEDGSGQN